MKIKRTRSKVSSKLFRSSQLVKLCKTVVTLVDCLCLDAIQPLKNTLQDFKVDFYCKKGMKSRI